MKVGSCNPLIGQWQQGWKQPSAASPQDDREQWRKSSFGRKTGCLSWHVVQTTIGYNLEDLISYSMFQPIYKYISWTYIYIYTHTYTVVCHLLAGMNIQGRFKLCITLGIQWDPIPVTRWRWQRFMVTYFLVELPGLVNIQKTMENHHAIHGENSLFRLGHGFNSFL